MRRAVVAWQRDHEPEHVAHAISFSALAEDELCLLIVICPDECQELPSGEREGCPQLTPSQLLTSIGVPLPFVGKTSVHDSVPAISDFVC